MFSLKNETDILREVPEFIRLHRQNQQWRQIDLAKRSGVSVATLRRFERTGQISFMAFAKLLAALALTDRFLDALAIKATGSAKSIDEFIKPVVRKKRVRLVR
jgi:transcriptional regulator with XRE-family HTH domain